MLTKAEKEVMQYIEYPINDIAKMLCISPNTVRTHLAKIRKKYKVHSRSELCSIYYHNKINEQQNEIVRLHDYIIQLRTTIFNLKNNKGVCNE